LPAAALLAWAAALGVAAVRGKRGTSGVRTAYAHSGAIATVAAASALLAAGPAWLAARSAAEPGTTLALALPLIEGCGAPGEWVGDWYPVLDRPDAVASGTYSCPAPVNVFVATYLSNTQGHEVVGAANRLVPDAWRRLATLRRAEFESADGRRVEVNELQVAADGAARVLVWYWYATDGETAAGEAAIKLRQALQTLEHGRSDGSIFLAETPLDESIATSRSRLARAAREVAALATLAARERAE
jgi:EpsI family protein